MIIKKFFAIAVTAVVAVSTSVLAQNYPVKTVRFISPYAPGGGTDIMARLLAEPMREDLGQPVLVENKPGAGGALGTAEVGRGAPDGYTVLVTAAGFVIGPSVLKEAGYDPVKDFVGVSQIAIVPLILLTRPDSPLNSLADLLALAKKDGSNVSFASFGNGTPSHLVGEAIKLLAGVQMTHIPYKGGPPAMPDILSGAVTVGVLDAVSMAPLVKQGRFKALAVTGPKRIAALPDKPTLVEGGIRFDSVGWHGTFVAAATPPAIVARLNRAFVKALSRPDIRERIVTGGSVPIEPAYTAEQWTEKYRKEVAEWAAIARASGAKAD